MTPAHEVRTLIAAVAHDHGMTYDDMVGPGRTRRVASVRHLAMESVVAARPNLSMGQIGGYFNRAHSTVLYALGRHINRVPAWKKRA